MLRKVLFFALVLGPVGCGGPDMRSDPTPVSGQVSFSDGRPVSNLKLSLQPLDQGHPIALDLGADGRFSGNLIPGRYAYCITTPDAKTPTERQKYEAALRAIPEKYRTASKGHMVKV